MIKKILLCLVLSCTVLSIQAEYRVYQYHIKAKNIFGFDQKSYIVVSSYDPVTYLAYHGGEESLKIDLLRTWVCYGQTSGNKKYCSPPSESQAEGGQL